MLRWDSQLTVDLEPYYWLTFPYSPYLLGFGLNFIHGQMPAHPFDDPEAHPENYLTLLSEYADGIEQLNAHIRGQMERGIYVSKHALPGVTGMFESFAAGAPSFIRVSKERLAVLGDDQSSALQTHMDQLIDDRVTPAFDALLGTLRSDDYLANAPDAVGLAQYPDGEAFYRLMVKAHTTMDVRPEELHELGTTRVAELEADMAAIRDELGFTGI